MPPAKEHIPSKWSWHYRALLRIRDTLLRDHNEHETAVRVPFERGGEDDIDRATEKSEQDTLLSEIRLEEAELAEVDAAIDRIRRGTYGVCEATGHPISEARLRAIPWTRLCHQAALRQAARLQE